MKQFKNKQMKHYNEAYELFKMKLRANDYDIMSFAKDVKENPNALRERVSGRRGRGNKEAIKVYLEKLNELVK